MCWLPSRHSARRLEELSRSSRGLEGTTRSEEHTSELQSQSNLVCRLLLEKKKECKHPHLARQLYAEAQDISIYDFDHVLLAVLAVQIAVFRIFVYTVSVLMPYLMTRRVVD